MPWFAVDDSAHSHPKLLRAGNAAVGLWLRCGSYASQHLTDGIVPGAVAAMYGTAPQILKLVRVGLWHAADHDCTRCVRPAAGDYVMHDYSPPNPTRQEVLQRRAKAAAKKRQQRGIAPDSAPIRDGNELDSQGKTDPIHSPVFDEPAGHRDTSRGDSLETSRARVPSPPLPSNGSEREKGERSGGLAPEALSLISSDWQPAPDDVRAAQAARVANGRPVLTGAQLAEVTRKFVRRMTADRREATNWGPRWQDWAERERPTDSTAQPSLLLGLDDGNAPLWPHEQPQPAPAPEPLRNCPGCDRAHRSAKPGLCRDCDASTDTQTA
ncbi:hypothetical protein [Streptacidiphilus sp. MAP5-3]|uniref:hypothetical protein n=1 Tax=unclassified Streptacidiphilus TaxID=2643834 RepID=UPI00351519F5